MSNLPTEKQTKNSSSNKDKDKNPNAILKYSGMAFQMVIIIVVFVFIGQKLDAKFGFSQPYMTILGIILALPAAFYFTLKDLF